MLAYGDGKEANSSQLPSHLICELCGGYLIGATTVTECLHSFCRSCLLKYLKTKDVCPSCDTKVHKDQPLCNIRQDGLLQDLVFKLVPGLFQSEIQRRLEFLEKQRRVDTQVDTATTDAISQTSCHNRQRTESSNHDNNVSPGSASVSSGSNDATKVCNPISVSLVLTDRRPVEPDDSSGDNALDTRYLLCPEQLTVGHLKKFVHLKFTLQAYFQVEFYHKGQRLLDELTLRNVARLYDWKQCSPLCLSYTVFDPVSVFLQPRTRGSLIPSSLCPSDASLSKNNGEICRQENGDQGIHKDLKKGLKVKSVILQDDGNVNRVKCGSERVNGPCDMEKCGLKPACSGCKHTAGKHSISRSKGIKKGLCTLESIRNSQTRTKNGHSNASISQLKNVSSHKVAPKIVIRRKRRLDKKIDGDSTPRTHKQVKKSKLAVCKVTENGQVKLIISNPRTDSVKRKLLDNDSISQTTCAKSPRIQSPRQQQGEDGDGFFSEHKESEKATVTSNGGNGLIATTKPEYLSAAAAGIACITSVSFSSSLTSPTATCNNNPPASTSSSGVHIDRMSKKEAEKKSVFEQQQWNGTSSSMINQKEFTASIGISSKGQINPSEHRNLGYNKLNLSQSNGKPSTDLKQPISSPVCKTQSYNNEEDNNPRATSTARNVRPPISLLQRTCANNSYKQEEQKCTVSQISMTKGKPGNGMREAGNNILSPLLPPQATAVKLEKDSLMTVSESQHGPTSAEQISSTVISRQAGQTSCLNTFSSPLNIKTDLSKTLFERILDEFSPKKEMKEISHTAAVAREEKISGINNTSAPGQDKVAFSETKMNNSSEQIENHYKEGSCNKSDEVTKGLFTKTKMADGIEHPSVKSGSEVKKEQLDMKRANGRNFPSNEEIEEKGVVKNNNSTAIARDESHSSGYRIDDVKCGQKASDNCNEIGGSEAFNVTRPVAVIKDWSAALEEQKNSLINSTAISNNDHQCVNKSSDENAEEQNQSGNKQSQTDEIFCDLKLGTAGHKNSPSSTMLLAGKSKSKRVLLSAGNQPVGDEDHSYSSISSSNISNTGLSNECQAPPLKINVRWDRKEQVYNVSQSPPDEREAGTEIKCRQKHRSGEGKIEEGNRVTMQLHELRDKEHSSDSSEEDLDGEEGTLIIDEKSEEKNSSLNRESCDKNCDRESIRTDKSTAASLTGEQKEASYCNYRKEEGEGEGWSRLGSEDNQENNEVKTRTTGGQLQIDRVSKLNNSESVISLLQPADNEGINVAGNDLRGPNGTISFSQGSVCADQCQSDKQTGELSVGTASPPIIAANSTLPSANTGSTADINPPSLKPVTGAASLSKDTHSSHTDSPPHAKIKRITETKRIGNGCHGNLKVVFSLIPKQPKSGVGLLSRDSQQKSSSKLLENLEEKNTKANEKSEIDISKENHVSEDTKAEANTVVLKTPSVPKQAASKAHSKKLKRRPISSIFGLDKSALPSCPSVNVTPLGMFASPRVQIARTPCEVSTPSSSVSASTFFSEGISTLNSATSISLSETPVTSRKFLPIEVSQSTTSVSLSGTPVTSRKSSVVDIGQSNANQEKNIPSVSKVLLSIPDCSRLSTKSPRSSSILSVPSSSVCIKSENRTFPATKSLVTDDEMIKPTASGEEAIKTSIYSSSASLTEQKMCEHIDTGCSSKETCNVNSKSVRNPLFASPPLCNKTRTGVLTSNYSEAEAESYKIFQPETDTLCPHSEPSAIEKNAMDILKHGSSTLVTTTSKDKFVFKSKGNDDKNIAKSESYITSINKTLPVFKPDQLSIPQAFSNGSIFQQRETTKNILGQHSVEKDVPVSTESYTGAVEKHAKKTAGYMVKPKQLFEAMKSRQLKQKNSSENRPSVLPFPGRQKRPDFNSTPTNPTTEQSVLLKSNQDNNKAQEVNLNHLPKLNEAQIKTKSMTNDSQQAKSTSKLKSLAEISRLADSTEDVLNQNRNPVLPRNVTTTPPLMLTPSFYGAPYVPYAAPHHFAGTYLHPMLPLMMGLDRTADDLYLQRAPLYEQSGHVTNLYERYYATHSPSIFPIRCLEDGPSSHSARIDAPLDFSTRGIASANTGSMLKKATSVTESHPELNK